MDLAILADISQSLRTEDLHRLRDAIHDVVERVGVSERKTRVAVVTFGGNTSVVNNFANSTYYNANYLKTRVTEALRSNSRREGTRTDLAQRQAATKLFTTEGGDRPDVRNVMLIFTDGKFYISKKWDRRPNITLLNTTRELEKKGVRIIVVGIGKDVSKEKIKKAAGSKEEVIIHNSYGELIEKLQKLIDGICICPMDVAFIMDSSGSIKRAEFYEERLLVKKLVVQVTATGNREALILFGSSASVKAQLGQYDTAEKYIEVVQKLRKKNGRTRIDRALDVAVDEVFSSARPYAYKIVIVLSDGVQSKGAKSLRESSRPLRQANVRVLAVGIGTGMAKNRLRLMTGSDDDVVDVKDIDGHLQYIITNIYRNPCGALRKYQLV
ncbi:unnamed protein product, partial [Pocillopora meandrina]